MARNWQWDCKCFTWYWCCIPGRCSMVLKGIFGRLLFTAYTIGVTYLFTIVLKDHEDGNLPGLAEVGLFACAAALCASTLETALTLCCKKYGEWKLFSPSVFIYLGCSTFELFLINLHFVDRRIIESDECAAKNANSTNTTDCSIICNQLDKLEGHVLSFEQALVVLLIIGRWLLPRGKMTLMKFSDMLIVYFGMSVDILDFLTQGLAVSRCNVSASQIVLILTAISLVQFTLDIELMLDKFDRIQRRYSISTFTGIREVMKYPEVRTILMNMFLQDLPFLVVRIYIMFFADNIVDRKEPLFFAIKNVMVLSLQSYRLWILIAKGETQIKIRKSLKKKLSEMSGTDNEDDEDKPEADAMMLEHKDDDPDNSKNDKVFMDTEEITYQVDTKSDDPDGSEAIDKNVSANNDESTKSDFVTAMVDPKTGEPMHAMENMV